MTEQPQPIERHPWYSINSVHLTASTIMVAAYDKRHGEQPFLCLESHTVKVKCLDGETRLHFSEDDSIIKVADTYRTASGRMGRRFLYFENKAAAEINGFKFSFRLGHYAKEEDPNFYGTEKLLSYHSNARTDYTSPEDEWKVGLEVEKEQSDLAMDVNVWKLFTDTGWAKETDGSLGSGGFELVSPILPLNDNKKLRAACMPVKKYLNAGYSRNCGGHIHLSKKGLSAKGVAKLLKNSMGIIYAIYKRRIGNSYCRVHPFNNYLDYPNKYNALNVSNGTTCEIRIFPAVKNYQNLMWRVTMLRYFLGYHKTFAEKLVALKNQNTQLHLHFRKLFTVVRINEIIKDAVKYHEQYVEPLSVKDKEMLAEKGIDIS